MSGKLALKNVKKSMKDYTIYFLTLLFAVCLFYVFNSMDSQKLLFKLSRSQNETIETLIRFMGYISVFVAVVLGFLIVYANNFLIRRRKKELGLYLVLGMDGTSVGWMLVKETILIGVFALVSGLITGVLLSQGLSVITAKLMQLDMEEFHFVFSSAAAGRTILYFGLTFLVVILVNIWLTGRLKLIDLLAAARKNEGLKIKKLWVSVVLFILSVICIGLAYKTALQPDLFVWIDELGRCLILGSIGTFLFFLSLSGFLLRIVRTSKRFYYRGLNAFVMKQINAKITTTFVSMTFICLMLLISIVTLSAGGGYVNAQLKESEETLPADLSLMSEIGVDNNIRNKEMTESYDLMETLKELEADEYFTAMTRMDFYGDGEFLGEIGGVSVGAVVPLSQWNEEMKRRGKPQAEIQPGEMLINVSEDTVSDVFTEAVSEKPVIDIYGTALCVSDQITTYAYGNGYYIESRNEAVFIVPDEVIRGDHICFSVYNLTYAGEAEETEAFIQDNYEQIYHGIHEQMLLEEGGAYTFQTRIHNMQNEMGNKMLIAFLTLYVGAVFLITSAAVLALQQLSESSDNLDRYTILRKIGVEEKAISKALFTQIFLYFMVPLALALVHSLVGIRVGSAFILEFGEINVISSIVYCAAGLLVIYGSYMVATYFGAKSMLRERS